MNDLHTEPEAKTDTTVSTIENTNTDTATAGTKAEIELTAEQLADREKVNAINNTIEKAGKQFILNRIKLGLLLVNLKKKYKELFWIVIDTSKVSRKTLERAMVLVLKDESVFSKAMSIDGAEKDIAENIELLVIDERVKALDMEALPKIYKPTLKKIADMKNLSDKDWAEVISGTDKPFKKWKKAEARKAADKKAKQTLANKPKTMDSTIYLDYVAKDKLFSIEKIAELEHILFKNGLLPKEESKLIYIPTVSKSESEEA